MDIDSTIAAVGAVATAIGGVFGGAMWARKRKSSDDLEIDRDKRERSVMSDLQHERDLWHTEVQRQREQVDAAKQAASEATMRARLAEGDYANLLQRYERLRRRASRLADRLIVAGLIDPIEAQDLATRFGGLDEIPPAPERNP
jgi:hypothetical protein